MCAADSRGAKREVRRKAIHEPSVKDRLCVHVEQPGKSWGIVVNDGEERAPTEHLAELEAGSAVGSTKCATHDVEELAIATVAPSGSFELEKGGVEGREDETEAVGGHDINANQAAQHPW